MFLEFDKKCKRSTIYDNYKEMEPLIMDRVDIAIKLNSKVEFEDRVHTLNNLKRNIKYHFESKEFKELIMSDDKSKKESPIHDITRIPLYIHMISAICCLSFSSFFHLFC